MDVSLRLLQRLGAYLRFLPTTGVCKKRFGASLRLLLTTGVWEQHLARAPDLGMPTAGVCDQRLGVCLRHLPKAGVYDLAHTALSLCGNMQGHLLTAGLVSSKCRKMDILAIF